ncbi:MAG: hypothetical protein RIS22_1069, partial [Actinomycetota bacterium]
FTLDKITQELVLSVAEGAKNIRVPIGQVQFNLMDSQSPPVTMFCRE